MATAVITGITGQDGSYLAELLLSEGTSVVGVVRDEVRAIAELPESLRGKVDLFHWDMRDEDRLNRLLADACPSWFYNLGALARGSAMFEDPVSIGEVNGLAVTRILEAIRVGGKDVRFCQASSSEMYGQPTEVPQNEQTPMRPASPYAAAKHYAHAMVQSYRSRFGLFACSAILFNHESPRRGMSYVTRKITHTAAKIKLGLATELRLGDLEARRDWGFAPDYVRAMALMLRADQANDFVVATGESHSVREFCEAAFGRLGLEYSDHVIEDSSLLRGAEAAQLVGDSSRARTHLHWQPSKSFQEMVELMVDNDMNLLKQLPLT